MIRIMIPLWEPTMRKHAFNFSHAVWSDDSCWTKRIADRVTLYRLPQLFFVIEKSMAGHM